MCFLRWAGHDDTSAFVPADISIKFPARCVCCLDPDVEYRDIEAVGSVIHSYGTKDGVRRIEAQLPIRVAGVPYCSAHAAEHDGHLAWGRMSAWEQIRARKKNVIPEPKRLPDGKKADFCQDGEGGTLGMLVNPQPALGWMLQDPPKVVHAYTEIDFQNPEYAKLFREANSLQTVKEHEKAVKERG